VLDASSAKVSTRPQAWFHRVPCVCGGGVLACIEACREAEGQASLPAVGMEDVAQARMQGGSVSGSSSGSGSGSGNGSRHCCVMDCGPEKLDNALLLDHGVLDASSGKVSVRVQALSHLVPCACVCVGGVLVESNLGGKQRVKPACLLLIRRMWHGQDCKAVAAAAAATAM
jgi:hypothetical protein